MTEPAARATCHADVWRGLPCWRVVLPQGDSLLVAEQGAQVLSWVADGRERLFLSPGSAADRHTAIRGGVPICWPQFSQRGPLPKHGFVHNLPWQRGAFHAAHQLAELRLHLQADATTRALWPQDFELTLRLRLAPGQLWFALDVFNPGPSDWAFTGALHTYLAVGDVTQVQLHGLGGQTEWDALRDHTGRAQDTIHFPGAFDRVCEAAPGALAVIEGEAPIMELTQSPHWANTVVWTPGRALEDLPGDHQHRMLCVEAAQVLAPVSVPAGERWVAWQQLQLPAARPTPGPTSMRQ